ncbi:TPA: hypothetical protein ACNAB8_004760 [Escherichia coli]
MGRLVAPEMRSQTLRRTKWVLNAHQGMEGAKNAYREFQEARRAEAPRQRVAVVTGTTGQRPAPPAKPNRTGLVATRLVGGRRPSVLQRWGAGVLPRRFPVALKALPEPWQEKICDDARHGVSKFIIAAAIDGTYKDLIVICEWLLTTRQEYFALTVEGIATIVLKNGKKIVEYSIAVGHSECEQYFVLFSIVLCSSRGMNARSTVI